MSIQAEKEMFFSAREMLNVVTRACGTDVLAASTDLGRGRIVSEHDSAAPFRCTSCGESVLFEGAVVLRMLETRLVFCDSRTREGH